MKFDPNETVAEVRKAIENTLVINGHLKSKNKNFPKFKMNEKIGEYTDLTYVGGTILYESSVFESASKYSENIIFIFLIESLIDKMQFDENSALIH